jgi:hypothetical protein
MDDKEEYSPVPSTKNLFDHLSCLIEEEQKHNQTNICCGILNVSPPTKKAIETDLDHLDNLKLIKPV